MCASTTENKERERAGSIVTHLNKSMSEKNLLWSELIADVLQQLGELVRIVQQKHEHINTSDSHVTVLPSWFTDHSV